jgi:hypothetical protein
VSRNVKERQGTSGIGTIYNNHIYKPVLCGTPPPPIRYIYYIYTQGPRRQGDDHNTEVRPKKDQGRR